MAACTVSRGEAAVTFDVTERAGSLVIARDLGKPAQRVYNVGGEDPKASDHRSANDSFTVVGQLTGGTAYGDALTLAEDIVKTHSEGTAATLTFDGAGNLGSYDVAFPNDRSLSLHYPPGRTEWVSLQLNATVVDGAIG